MTAAYTYLITTGTISVDTTDLLKDVETEWKTAFGSTLNVDASTPQGTMIAAETTARTSVMKNNADLANMQNPNLAYGTFLDAICMLLGVERGVNVSTKATAIELHGDAGTVVVAGSRIKTTNQDVFSLINTVTIAPSGMVLGDFLSQAYGNIPVPSGELTIVDGTLGWGSARLGSNTTISPGSIQSTDAQLRNRRNEQLSVQGTASAAAILANVLNVPNVTSAQVVENNTGAAGVVNGVTFTKPNAIWVCVAGNNPRTADVADALYAAHNSGCPWDYGAAGNGVPVNSPDGVIVIDPSTGLPYTVKYTTPILYDTYIHVDVHQTPDASPGIAAIQNTILDFCQGLVGGEAGLVVGADLSAFEVSGAVARAYPGVYVKNCKVAAVPAGGAAPVYPGGYSYEWVANQFEQGVQQIGNISVVLV
jgi:Baseplate J-like protein